MAEPETDPAPVPEEENSLETPDADENSLEGSPVGSDAVASSGSVTDATSQNGTAAPAQPPKKSGGLKALVQRFNIYLLIFVFLLVIAGGILVVAYFQSKKASTASTIKTQALTQSTLQQIAASDTTVGSTQQVLNVQSSAVFAGRVLIKEGIEVAGNLQVGGTSAFVSLTVSGTTQLGQTQINKDLSVAGNSAIQGTETIAKSIQVGSGGTFGGPVSAPQITTTSFQLNGDLVLTHHITTGGATPSLSQGSALGSGGTASISGSDTSGSVSINVGSNTTAGCFAVITFASKYNATPHVLLTPVESGAGALAYYVTRTTSSFSICDATAAPTGTSFGFDYFITD